MQLKLDKYFKKTGTLTIPVFLFLGTLLSHISFGQIHEFGMGVGALNYIGDINPRINFSEFRPGGNIFYRFNSLNRVTAFRLAGNVGNLMGNENSSNDPYAKNRQASFSGMIWEGSLMAEYNFINYRDKKQLLKFSPYLTTGFSVYTFKAKVLSNAQHEEINDNRVNFALPIGIGIKFILNENWNLGIESIAHKSFSDHLDGISKGEINQKTTGNTLDKDWYFFTGINLSYTIYGVKCPQEYKY